MAAFDWTTIRQTARIGDVDPLRLAPLSVVVMHRSSPLPAWCLRHTSAPASSCSGRAARRASSLNGTAIQLTPLTDGNVMEKGSLGASHQTRTAISQLVSLVRCARDAPVAP